MKLSAEKQNYLLDLYLLSPAELASNIQLPSESCEISDFLELAAHNKVGANLFLQLKRLNFPIPASLLLPLEETYQKIRAKNIRRLEVGLPILNELKKANIEVIILKGNAIAEEIFQDIGYKPMNDIDILVKKEDLAAIYEIFLKNHMLTAAPLESDIRKQEKYSHHWPPFFDKKLEVFLGTHWNIAAPTRGLDIPVQDFWKDKEKFELMGETYFRLAPKHFLLHLCVHLNSAKTGLREIGDIVKLIEARESDLLASEFVEMVIKAHAENEVYEALSLVAALRAFPFTEAVLKKLDQLILDEHFKKKVQKRLSPRHKILHIRTNYISKIEKTFALFMLTEAPVEKSLLLAKMWKLYLLVPGPEALRLAYDFPEASLFKKITARLVAPIKISRVFINDLGLLIFLIVTMRHQWVLSSSYGTYIIKKIKGEPIHSLDSIALGMGLTFKEMKEISALD
ncbi:MAG: nucleotidyltransferase family protein [Bacteriovorax sp.]|nr:nucleotidyltransferase family protein [Bacteriovorax sp.]